jgi:DnaK suppressor protein
VTQSGKTSGKPPTKPSLKPSTNPSAGGAAAKQPRKAVAPAAAAAGATKTAARTVARPAARPARTVPIAVSPKIEAPKKFQREYKRWLERLIALRHALLRDGERLEEEGLKALEQEVSVDHMADYGSDSYEQDNTLALIESKSEALRDVDESIRKIEARSYGLCEECEQLIPAGRLAVLPHARFCVTCQAKREGVVE